MKGNSIPIFPFIRYNRSLCILLGDAYLHGDVLPVQHLGIGASEVLDLGGVLLVVGGGNDGDVPTFVCARG